jgi:hypothetical protein
MKNIGAWIAILIAVLMLMSVRVGYVLSPTSVEIEEKGSIENVFKGEYALECVPGAPRGSAYTRNLTPGGTCGIQRRVADTSDYHIVGGIGGELV